MSSTAHRGPAQTHGWTRWTAAPSLWTTSRDIEEQRIEEEEGGTCRTLAPTLFLQAYDLRVRAEAVPRRAVVDGLEVRRDDVTHGQGGDHSFLCGDALHGVAARCSGLQHRFFPGPGLRRDSGLNVHLLSLVILWRHRQVGTFVFQCRCDYSEVIRSTVLQVDSSMYCGLMALACSLISFHLNVLGWFLHYDRQLKVKGLTHWMLYECKASIQRSLRGRTELWVNPAFCCIPLWMVKTLECCILLGKCCG